MGNVDEHVKELSAKLNLTADQQTKVKAILEEHHQQMQAMMKDESMSKEDKHAKMESMHDSVHAKVREVLNDDQKTKFDAMVKDMEEQHMHAQRNDMTRTKPETVATNKEMKTFLKGVRRCGRPFIFPSLFMSRKNCIGRCSRAELLAA